MKLVFAALAAVRYITNTYLCGTRRRFAGYNPMSVPKTRRQTSRLFSSPRGEQAGKRMRENRWLASERL